MKTPRQRATALNVRGNVALFAALTVGAFLAANRLAQGPWLPLHTWLAAGIATAAVTALACYTLAWRVGSPRGDSPEVTHPPATPSLARHEVRK